MADKSHLDFISFYFVFQFKNDKIYTMASEMLKTTYEAQHGQLAQEVQEWILRENKKCFECNNYIQHTFIQKLPFCYHG